MTIGAHPRKNEPCPGCGRPGPSLDWQKGQQLPQVGQTYKCPDCGEWVYAYDNSDHGTGKSKIWAPVTAGMAASLQFFDLAGDYPDSALEDLFKRGLERYEAIDYHAVEEEGLSQTEWAERRGASQQAVSENVRKAREKLGE